MHLPQAGALILGKAVPLSGEGVNGKISVPFFQFCCEPKTALKKVVFLNIIRKLVFFLIQPLSKYLWSSSGKVSGGGFRMWFPTLRHPSHQEAGPRPLRLAG